MVIAGGTDGRYLDVNHKFEELVGYSRNELLGRTSAELGLIDANDRNRRIGVLKEARFLLDTPAVVKTRSGAVRHVLSSSVLIEQDGEPRYLSVHYDLTERVQAEESLIRQEAHYRRALEDSGLVAARVDRDLRYVWIHNPHPDFDPSAVVGKRDDELLAPEEAAEIISLKQEVLATCTKVRRVLRFDRSDGVHYYDMSGVPLFDDSGHLVGLTTVSLDVTEQKRLEAELESLNVELEKRVQMRTEQVRHLASALSLAEQEERRRVAQILHDDFQQLLYAVQFKLGATSRYKTLTQTQEGLREASRLVSKAIDTVRTLMVDLSPPLLPGDGLDKALLWLAGEMRNRFDVEFEIEQDASVPVRNEDMRVLLFQIIRELMFNAVKHSGTDRVIISLHRAENGLAIEVADQGKGFDPAILEGQPQIAPRLGLTGMRERLQLFDGDISVQSQPGKGTTVIVFIPDHQL